MNGSVTHREGPVIPTSQDDLRIAIWWLFTQQMNSVVKSNIQLDILSNEVSKLSGKVAQAPKVLNIIRESDIIPGEKIHM